MLNIKNLSRIDQNFVIGQKDGNPVTKTVKPGKTESVAVKEDNPLLQGLLHVGAAVIVKGDAPAASKAGKGETAAA